MQGLQEQVVRETGLEGVVQESPEVIYSVSPAEWRALSRRMDFLEFPRSLTEAARASSVDELAACSEAALSKIFGIKKAEVRIHASSEDATSCACEGLGRSRFRIDSQGKMTPL